MIYNKFLEKIILPLGDFILKTNYIKWLKYWRRIDKLTLSEIKNIQKENLKIILKKAKNIPLYKNVLLEGENSEEWLKNFPILTKKKLNENIENMLTENKSGLKMFSTSGSSGIRTDIYMNKSDLSSFRAGNTRWWEWLGYKVGDNLIQTGITPNRKVLKKLKDIFFKTIYVNAFSMSEKDMFKILNKVKRKKYYLLGYASSLNILAEFALEKNIFVEFKGIISLGDKLFNHYKKNINQAFKAKIIETYGTSEGFLIACQYDLNYLYINSAQVYLEILDDHDKPVKDGEMGHVVVTRLDNSAMPLIRYKIGDLAIKLPKNKYPKNRKFNYPLLEKVIGRDTDIIVLPDNRKLVVHSFTGVFEYYKEIKQFKVIQYDIEGITIEYIKSSSFYLNILNKILNDLQLIIKDSSFAIVFKEVNVINATKSGKPQIIQSFINSINV